jgi:protein O-GlcNAc transferase
MKKSCILVFLLLLLAACRSSGPASRPEQETSRYYVNLGKGVDALQRNDYQEAIHFLKLAIAEKSDSVRALNLRGVAYLMDDKIREARADFEKVIRLDPAFDRAYQNLGCCLAGEKKLAEAETTLRLALDRFPASASMYFTLGSVIVLQGRVDEAMAVLRKGMDLDPDYFTREKQFATGLGLQDTGSPELFLSYARLFAASGNAAKAAEYLGKARAAGFGDWQRLATMSDFDPVRADPLLKEFMK